MTGRSKILALVMALASTIAMSRSVLGQPAQRAATGKKGQGAKAEVSPEAVKESLDHFCEEWMAKLRQRERDNLGQIAWKPHADGVAGTYVGYSQEYTCTVVDLRPPVGKINYMETLYEMRGATQSVAQESKPTAIERYNTTEIFTYIKGKWAY